jgi:hypothetical protein
VRDANCRNPLNSTDSCRSILITDRQFLHPDFRNRRIRQNNTKPKQKFQDTALDSGPYSLQFGNVHRCRRARSRCSASKGLGRSCAGVWQSLQPCDRKTGRRTSHIRTSHLEFLITGKERGGGPAKTGQAFSAARRNINPERTGIMLLKTSIAAFQVESALIKFAEMCNMESAPLVWRYGIGRRSPQFLQCVKMHVSPALPGLQQCEPQLL